MPIRNKNKLTRNVDAERLGNLRGLRDPGGFHDDGVELALGREVRDGLDEVGAQRAAHAPVLQLQQPRSSARVFRTRALSMLSAATSLTTTATRKLPAFSTMRLSSVVLPVPRNPERRVTGIGVCMIMSWLKVVCTRGGFWGIYQTLCRSSQPRNLPRNVSFHEVRVQIDSQKCLKNVGLFPPAKKPNLGLTELFFA